MGTTAVDTTGELEGLKSWRGEVCEAFVDQHYTQVFRFFQWLTADREAAADLTQETFAAFWESVARKDPATVPDLKAWLFGIARNRWRKRLRDRPPTWEGLEACLELVDGAPGPEACALTSLDTGELLRAVSELPPDFREALVLRVFQELEYDQIAETLGISGVLARWRVHQGRQRLRSRLTAGSERKEKTGAGSA